MRISIKWLVLTASALFIGCGGRTPDDETKGSGGGSSSSASGGKVVEECKDAKKLVGQVDKVSPGEVIDLSTVPEEKVVYIDASAGGPTGQATSPWIYMSLSKAQRVDVTDVSGFSSTDWDLAMKRSGIRTNNADSGPGMGGAVFLEGRDYASVTSADATMATLKTESWFSAPCEPIFDESGRLVTTFTGWYDYNIMNHTLAPHPGTFIVRDAAGVLYKLAILDFYATPDGGTGGMTLGRYRIQYQKLLP